MRSPAPSHTEPPWAYVRRPLDHLVALATLVRAMTGRGRSTPARDPSNEDTSRTELMPVRTFFRCTLMHAQWTTPQHLRTRVRLEVACSPRAGGTPRSPGSTGPHPSIQRAQASPRTAVVSAPRQHPYRVGRSEGAIGSSNTITHGTDALMSDRSYSTRHS